MPPCCNLMNRKEMIQSKKQRGSVGHEFRCPEPLESRLQEYIQRTGAESVSEIVRQALTEFLDTHKPENGQKNSR